MNPKPLLPIFENESPEEKAERERQQHLEAVQPRSDDSDFTALKKWLIRNRRPVTLYSMLGAMLFGLHSLDLVPLLADNTVNGIGQHDHHQGHHTDDVVANLLRDMDLAESRRQLAEEMVLGDEVHDGSVLDPIDAVADDLFTESRRRLGIAKPDGSANLSADIDAQARETERRAQREREQQERARQEHAQQEPVQQAPAKLGGTNDPSTPMPPQTAETALAVKQVLRGMKLSMDVEKALECLQKIHPGVGAITLMEFRDIAQEAYDEDAKDEDEKPASNSVVWDQNKLEKSGFTLDDSNKIIGYFEDRHWEV